MDPVELAWTLIDGIERWPTAEERRDADMKLGAGDTEAAIYELIAVAVREQWPCRLM